MSIRSALLFFSLLITAVSAKAQDIWSLEKCINYAWENNLQVKQQELAVERNENTLYQSKLSYIPNFNGSIGENFNWGKSVNLQDLEKVYGTSISTSASINASIYLLDGLSKINTVKSNKTNVDISIQEVAKLKNEISISLTKAFLQVLLSKQILSTTQENFKSISEQRDRTEKLVTAGSQAYSSLLDIESQMATERVQLVSAENSVKTSVLSLMQLMDLPYSSSFDVYAPSLEEQIPMTTLESIDSIYSAATVLPQIKSAELNLQKSKYDLTLAKGKYYPTISLSAGYGTYYSYNSTMQENKSFGTQFGDNQNPSIGLGMNIPIFNSWQVVTSVKNAKLNVKNYEIELKSRHQTLYKEIQSAVLDAVSYYEKYSASEINLKAMEESFRYTEQKFNVGAVNSTDYTVAKTNLFKAQSDYYQAKFQYIFQLKIIDFYKGIPISL